MSQKDDKRLPSNVDPTDGKELADGLIYIHNAIGTNIVNVQEAVAHTYALTEVLVSKGLISLHELDARKHAISEQMMKQTKERWMGARMLADETDKYEPDHEVRIDCGNRVHACKAACCRLGFYLSHQDLEEGVVRWDFGRPYHIKQNETGYCTHCESTSLRCGIWKHRPLTCRTYDCRNDKRIWIDFEKMIPSPELEKLPGPPGLPEFAEK